MSTQLDWASILIHTATLTITAVSGYYVYRQRTTAYGFAKSLLVGVHFFYGAIVSLDLIRSFSPPQLFMTTYAVVGPIFVLADVALLTALAVVIYFRPSGLGYKGLLREVLAKGFHAAVFIGFAAYLFIISLYLLLFAPFEIAQVPTISGILVPIDEFIWVFLLLLLVALVVFIAYPVVLLILAARKSKDVATRRTLTVLPICWTAIGVDLLAFNGYLVIEKIDATPVGYLIGGVIFGITAIAFRRASRLASFFEPILQGKEFAPSYPFSRRLGVDKGLLSGKKYLLELDPSVSYEHVLSEFALELVSGSLMVYVFTSKGSPIQASLSQVAGVRFYVLTGRVTYPVPGENTNELRVPENDSAILLDVIERTISSNPEAKVALIYDSISDLILSWGFEDTYKFLKQVNEMVNDARITALFLITSGAHEQDKSSLVKSIFPVHLMFDKSGLKLTRMP